MAYCNIITQEVLKGMIENLVSPIEAQMFDAFDTISVVAQLPHHVGRASNTAIRRSPMYEIFGPASKTPARLTPFYNHEGLRIDPFDQAIRRYDVKMPLLEDFKVTEAVHDVLNSIFKFKDQKMGEVLSYDDAVCGLENNPCLSSIDRSTSMGYPWSMENHPGYKGK